MTAMDMQTKYLQMLEEKTGLFRSIDARKRELTELDAAYEMLLIKAQELETRVKEMQSLPSPPQQEHDDYEDEEHDLLTSHEEGSIRRDSADAVETQRGGFDRIENADNEDDNDALIVVGTPIEKTHMEVVSSSSSPAPSSTGGSTRTSRAGTTNCMITRVQVSC